MSNSDGNTTSKEKKYKCKWEGCKPNTHIGYTYYPKGGVLHRDKYTGFWGHPFLTFKVKTTKKESWVTLANKTKLKVTAINYRFQKHHVIPINMFKNIGTFPALSKNLRLLNFDINSGDHNGICLPFFHKDIEWHDLQPHRGSHPVYDGKVKRLLSEIDKECKKYCKDDNQDKLLYDIYQTVQELKMEIVNWTTLLHQNSLNFR